MGLPPEVLIILLVIAGIAQMLRGAIARRPQTKIPPTDKRDRASQLEEELRKFLQHVAGQEIREDPPVPPPARPPTTPSPPPPPPRAPTRAAETRPPPVIPPAKRLQSTTVPPRSTVQVPAVQEEKEEVTRPRLVPELVVPQSEPAATARAVERLSLLPRVSVAPGGRAAPAARVVAPPPSMTQLETILAGRPMIQQGIVLSEILGPPAALRD